MSHTSPLVLHYFLVGLLFCLSPASATTSCRFNSDCGAGSYCSSTSCSYAVNGTCTPTPFVCPSIVDPVCTCGTPSYQFNNYCAVIGMGLRVDNSVTDVSGACGNNPCVATACATDPCASATCPSAPQAVCVSDTCNGCHARFYLPDGSMVASCSTTFASCQSNTDCSSGMYCQRTSCSAPLGTCIAKPQMCPMFILPVCTCDGTQQGNYCFAQQAGENIDQTKDGSCNSLNTTSTPNPFMGSSSASSSAQLSKQIQHLILAALVVVAAVLMAGF